MEEKLIDALDSVVWYNGLGDILVKWKDNDYFDNYEDYSLSWNMETYDSYDEDTKAQLQVIWMMCVCMFGEYGTSPRWGWVLVENKEAFHKFIDDITETFRECHQNEDDEEE